MNHKYNYPFVSTNKVESLHVLTTAVKIGLDVFCWTDVGGMLHCRILADRVRCHGKTVRGAKLQKHLIQNIYPDLEFSMLVKDRKALPKQFQPLVHELIGHPERAINWLALADLMQEEDIYDIRANHNRGGFHNIDSVREAGRFANTRICQGALETV